MTTKGMNTAQISARVSPELKEAAYELMKEQGITPTELITNTLEYYVRFKKPPVRKEILSDEDSKLLQQVKERISDPNRVIVKDINLDELLR